MLFNSFGYLIFLPLVVLAFWASPPKLRTYVLLTASYGFYMSWKPIYGLLIAGLTLMNYVLGLLIAHSRINRKLWLIVAVIANLLTLAIFKYAYFVHDVGNQMLSPLGMQLSSIPFQIILPLGISFFVFEFIHYVSDVYNGGTPVKSFPDFALFASFFPTQIAGPIKRYQDFIPQLASKSGFSLECFEEGISLILFGLFKKVLFADNLAVVVQSAFDHGELLSSLDLWLAVYAFAFQIYFDFSGYTDIARGSAQLFGYKVPLNFNLPYLADSISDFWRRWHISLSTWLRDYLFIPLGGSRGSILFNYRNLLITMVLGGLWHGASMHFIVWGIYQGILLVLHKEFQRLTAGISWLKLAFQSRLFHLFSIVLTFHLVCIGWVFFRADTLKSALHIIGKLLFLPERQLAMPPFALSIASTRDPSIFMILPLVLLLLFAGQLLSGLTASTRKALRLPVPLKALYVAVVVCLLMVFSPDTSPRFIYFQF